MYGIQEVTEGSGWTFHDSFWDKCWLNSSPAQRTKELTSASGVLTDLSSTIFESMQLLWKDDVSSQTQFCIFTSEDKHFCIYLYISHLHFFSTSPPWHVLSFWWGCLGFLLYKDEIFVTFVTNVYFQVILCFLILLIVLLHRMNNIYLVNLYQYSHLEMLLRIQLQAEFI